MTNEELTQEVAELKEGMLSLYELTGSLSKALSENMASLVAGGESYAGTLKARVAVSDALVCALVQSKLINPQLFELALKGQIDFHRADLFDGEKPNFDTSISNTKMWIDALK
ncbi:MAG: hypothetical protein HQ445_07830 [Polaromonas sp.]|nr:hypothetical protein [Polaromonas sp.]